ncbi:MAG: hypothetical protein KDI44_11085 [Thiothrix sp.]|nr:hypothetical protein [Thiothrix sp.]HPQ94164.1 hypothetical protein [Thiolinea sp.]
MRFLPGSVFCLGMLLPLSSQGCAMMPPSGPIVRMIVQPVPGLVAEGEHLPPELLGQLQALAGPTRLSYLRPMGQGSHLLGLDPPLTREQGGELAERWSGLDAIVFAEPDYPRQRR